MSGDKRGFKTYYRLGLIENWDWPLLWFSLPFYVLFTFLYDVLITGQWSLLWIATFTAGTVLEILLIVAAKKTFLPWLLSKPGAGFYGLLFAGFVNGCRNLLVAAMALDFKLEEKIDWVQRGIGGFVSGIVFILIFVSIAGSRIQHDSTMQKQKSIQRALVSQRAESATILAAENQKLLAQTQQTLLPRIDQIAKMLTTNRARLESIQELRALVADQVRPLSEQLRRGGLSLSQAPAPAEVTTVKTQFFIDRFNLSKSFRPVILLILGGATQFLIMQMLFGTAVAQANLLPIGIGSATLLLLIALIPKHKVVTRKSGMAYLCLILSTIGAPLFLTNLHRIEDLSTALMFSMVILFPILMGIALGNSAILDQAREQAEAQVASDNSRLERETSLFEQRMWLAKRNWSFVVHGTVQAALTAAISRLSASEELEQYQIDLVLQDLQRAKDALSKTPELDVDLNTALQAVVSTWQGICSVDWHFTERATRLLTRDVNARMCVNEIIKEAVSNAVRHGEANQVNIELDRTGDELLVVTVSNNGRAPRQELRNGLGSQMLDELTLSWSLTYNRAQAKTILEAKLALESISRGTL